MNVSPDNARTPFNQQNPPTNVILCTGSVAANNVYTVVRCESVSRKTLQEKQIILTEWENVIRQFSWNLATLHPDQLQAHARRVKARDDEEVDDGDLDSDCAYAGMHPSVFPKMCTSLKPALVPRSRDNPLIYKPTHINEGLKYYTFMHKNHVDHQVLGWVNDAVFVDVCAAPLSAPSRHIDNLYTLSNLGSSGLAAGTASSWFGEVTHKLVYLELLKRCRVTVKNDRYTQSVQQSKKQMPLISLVNRMVRAIVYQLHVPYWTIYDVSQPSTYTVPGLLIKLDEDKFRCARCIPDQILYRKETGSPTKFIVCEYKTRYTPKTSAANATTNTTNALSMVMQCIWQAVAFRLCTNNSDVGAKAVEVSVRSNQIANSKTRVVLWSCAADALPRWFAWALMMTMRPSAPGNTTKIESPIYIILKKRAPPVQLSVLKNQPLNFGTPTNAEKDLRKNVEFFFAKPCARQKVLYSSYY